PAAAPAAPADAHGWADYTPYGVAEGAWQMRYPADWDTVEKAGEVLFVAPNEDPPVEVAVTAGTGDAGRSLQAIAEDGRGRLAASFDGFDQREFGPAQVGGAPAWRLVGDMAGADGTPSEVGVLWVQGPGHS